MSSNTKTAFAIYTDRKDGQVHLEYGEFLHVRDLDHPLPAGEHVWRGPTSGMLYRAEELLDLTLDSIDRTRDKSREVVQEYMELIRRYGSLETELDKLRILLSQ